MAKPAIRIFVGSSSESEPVAVAFAAAFGRLKHVVVVPWRDALRAEATPYTIEKLLNISKKYTYAIFVYAKDDLVYIRDQERMQPRDNVVFEHGMFLGALGRDRVFYVIPSDAYDDRQLRIVSDLLGTEYFTYRRPSRTVSPAECISAAVAGIHSRLKAPNSIITQTSSSVGAVAAGISELKRHVDKLTKVEYLERFPGFMTRLNEEISKAKESLLISCDALLYGHFSAHDEYVKYRDTLRGLRDAPDRAVSVKLIIHDAAGSKHMRELQFGRLGRGALKRWKELLKIKSFYRNLKSLESRNHVAINSLKDFYDVVLDLEHDEMLDFEAHVVDDLHRARAVLPVNFWLVDGKVAVFSFASQGEESIEHAFLTRDPGLLVLFGKMWERRRGNHKPT